MGIVRPKTSGATRTPPLIAAELTSLPTEGQTGSQRGRSGSHTPRTAIRLRNQRRGSSMRRRDFIAGLSSTASWSTGAWAQRHSLPLIGYVSLATESASRTRQGEANTAAFRRGLGEQGYIEGRNVDILFRWAETQPERLPAILADLVARRLM